MLIDELLTEIENLKILPYVEPVVIGFSTFNRPIMAFHVGTNEGSQVFMEGGIHAREYLSTLFLIEEIKYLSNKYVSKTLTTGGFYVVPLLNPDGVALVLDGEQSVPCDVQKQVLKVINGGSSNYELWKANGLGVDLNVNFNAEWGRGRQNKTCPASENFIGFFPESERENIALLNYVLKININGSISWHTKGEVIYYGFYTLSESSLARDFAIAEKLSSVNGYPIIKTSGSVGGFSDWVSLNLDVPAYTIEVGNPNLNHPIGRDQLEVVFNQNKDVPIVMLNAL